MKSQKFVVSDYYSYNAALIRFSLSQHTKVPSPPQVANVLKQKANQACPTLSKPKRQQPHVLNCLIAKESPHLRMEIYVVHRVDFGIGSMAPLSTLQDKPCHLLSWSSLSVNGTNCQDT